MILAPLMLLASLPLATHETGGMRHAAMILPARFEAGRVFVVPRTRDGQELRLYTDTGGGLFLDERAVERLKLATTAAPAGSDAPPGAKLASLPRFAPGFAIPAPLGNGGSLFVVPAARAEKQAKEGIDGDGMLGEAWFAGRVWTWDYPGRRLVVNGAGWTRASGTKRVVLGFKTSADGKRETNFPRMRIRVDGKPIDVLLDTGATTVLTPHAMKALNDDLPAERATSMIVDEQFQAWRKRHPDWRVIDDAQQGSHAAMIEVPEVEIAGYRIGPVWFTWRPDANFHKFMSGFMDRQVEGAIGGNALEHFVMTIDYPDAAAYFECTRDCNRGAFPKPRSEP